MAEKSPEKPSDDKASGAGAAPTGDPQADPVTETDAGAQTAQVPVTVDVKSAFAAALERKKQAGQARSAHLDGHGGVGGATSSHKATRTFRRKSGSA